MKGTRISSPVVVLDLTMPEISGLDVLKRLEVRDPQIKCVVIMSGSRFEVANSITPNVFAALPKAFDIEALITTVGGCVEAVCDPAAPANHPVPKAA